MAKMGEIITMPAELQDHTPPPIIPTISILAVEGEEGSVPVGMVEGEGAEEVYQQHRLAKGSQLPCCTTPLVAWTMVAPPWPPS